MGKNIKIFLKKSLQKKQITGDCKGTRYQINGNSLG